MNTVGRNVVLWILALLFLIFLFKMFQGNTQKTPELTYDQFIMDIKQGNVATVVVKGDVISGRTKDGRLFTTRALPNDTELSRKLTESGARIEVRSDDDSTNFLSIFLSWFPMLLLIGVWIFFLRQMQSGNNKAIGFGKSRAKMLNENSKKILFKDVAGVEEAKEEVVEIVDFLKDPKKFQRLGGSIPKGVLMVGPPGTGKTLLARAIAGEANVPFFSISGSDFVEMFVGVGASRVRDMFEQGKKNAPCIIFIDEIDAMGRHRGAGLGGGNDEREQTLNQLLVEMDGFESTEGVILIAATNRPDVLDPALLRPGRFDRQVVVPLPDVQGRTKILEVHLEKISVAQDLDLDVLARGTPGFSGADLKNLVNEGALLAARRNKRVVTMAELEEAKDKIMMGGPERRSMVMSESEKKLTAYHEAGHALVALKLPHSDPIHKATIIPRGRALGMVVRLPEGDRLSMTFAKIKADLAVAMGGRIAEEIIFGQENVTTGASSDIKQATAMARKMVTEWGLSEALGPVSYSENQQEVFLGHSVAQQKNVSEKTAEQIDREIRRIVEEAYTVAKNILTTYLEELHTLSKALLEYETLSGTDIENLLAGIPLERKSMNPSHKKRSSIPMEKSSVSGSSVSGLQETRDEKSDPESRKGSRSLSKSSKGRSLQSDEAGKNVQTKAKPDTQVGGAASPSGVSGHDPDPHPDSQA